VGPWRDPLLDSLVLTQLGDLDARVAAEHLQVVRGGVVERGAHPPDGPGTMIRTLRY
jgi:hypothetical protein